MDVDSVAGGRAVCGRKLTQAVVRAQQSKSRGGHGGEEAHRRGTEVPLLCSRCSRQRTQQIRDM
eukprot:5035753-Pleurochrysis_carterae.AAC.1